MIKVARKKSSLPKILQSAGVIETNGNIKRLMSKRKKKPIFKVYKHNEVKEALIALFKGKCAYCESIYRYSSPDDIEHFRPKSRTIRKKDANKGYKGYYWLAADWDNLFLSCINCNRPKSHNVPGIKEKIVIGKHEQFPLDDETKRCCIHGRPSVMKREEAVRLLINPCKENPEKYFEYIEKDQYAGNIRPRSNLSGFRLRKAETSINVYALHRIDLVKERSRLLDDIHFRISVIDREVKRYKVTASKSRKKEAMSFIQQNIRDLVDYADPTQKYSALAKQTISAYLSTLGINSKSQ